MLCMCNLIVYFARNLFYKKLCNNISIFLVNININYFLHIIIKFVTNYFIKNYTMISMLLNDTNANLFTHNNIIFVNNVQRNH